MSPTSRVRVLDADPDLGRHLSSEEAAAVRHNVIASHHVLEAGPWQPLVPSDPGRDLGILITRGLMWREVTYGRHTFSELVGAGDLFRPWGANDDPGGPAEVRWTVEGGAEVAFLDGGCSAALGRFPAVTAQLLERAVRRSRSLALQLAICHQRRVDVRVLQILWLLALRWGRVTPDGVMLVLPLTHELLGRLVGAQRPSVTTCLAELTRRGAVTRRADGSWLLHGEAPEQLRQLDPD